MPASPGNYTPVIYMYVIRSPVSYMLPHSAKHSFDSCPCTIPSSQRHLFPFHHPLSLILWHRMSNSSCKENHARTVQVIDREGWTLSALTVLIQRGVSSCSSLGWPAGWPHLYLEGENSGWYNAWLSEWCNLTPAMHRVGIAGGPQFISTDGRSFLSDNRL